MIIKVLAAFGIIFIFICLSLILAAIMVNIEDPTTEEEDEEQAAYLKKWKEQHDEHRN